MLCADLILNEFKQIAFSALIENDRMLIMNAANICVASSSQRHVPSIKCATLYVRKPFAVIVLDAPSLMEPPRIFAYTVYFWQLQNHRPTFCH